MGEPMISLQRRAEAGRAAASSPGTAWCRPLLGLLSPAGARARLTILIFHRVHETADALFPAEMDAARFRERMTWVRDWFNVLPLEEAVRRLDRGDLPPRALAITFDDGYADNCRVALPILSELGLNATFFIASGFLDGGAMWNDVVIESVRAAQDGELDLTQLGLGVHRIGSIAERRAAIDALLAQLKYRPMAERAELAGGIAAIAKVAPRGDLMMSSAEVRRLAAAGMGIGAHTALHPILARLPDAQARQEIADGRDALAAVIGRPISLFAYPNGRPGEDYRAVHVGLARELGFAAAFSTAWGAARRGDSLYELPRFTPWDHSAAGWAMRLARNYLATPARAGA